MVLPVSILLPVFSFLLFLLLENSSTFLNNFTALQPELNIVASALASQASGPSVSSQSKLADAVVESATKGDVNTPACHLPQIERFTSQVLRSAIFESYSSPSPWEERQRQSSSWESPRWYGIVCASEEEVLFITSVASKVGVEGNLANDEKKQKQQILRIVSQWNPFNINFSVSKQRWNLPILIYELCQQNRLEIVVYFNPPFSVSYFACRQLFLVSSRRLPRTWFLLSACGFFIIF